jgi:hypothetical protein
MIRSCGITLSLLGLAFVVVSAQDPAKEPEPILKKKVKKSDEPELKKLEPKKNAVDEPELKKIDPKKKDAEPELKKIDPVVPEVPNRQSRAELIDRIDKNLKATAEELKKAADDPTRKRQRDIVKDLDELIKQQDDDNNNNSGGGGGGNNNQGGGGNGGNKGGASGQGGGQAGQGGGQANRNRSKRGGGGQGGNAGAQDKKDPQNAGANDKKDPKGGQDPKLAGGKDGGKDGGKKSDGGGLGSKDPPPPNDKDRIVNLRKDVWGHLPSHKRQEMDALMRENPLDRYRDIIGQYFDTIAGKSRGPEKK